MRAIRICTLRRSTGWLRMGCGLSGPTVRTGFAFRHAHRSFLDNIRVRLAYMTIRGFYGKVYEARIVSSLTAMLRAFREAGYYTFTAGSIVSPSLDKDWDYSAGHLMPTQWVRNQRIP